MSSSAQTLTTPGIRALSCLKPVPYRGRPIPCRRCVPCRRVRAFFLTTRLLVEGLAHKAVSLISLTYANSHLPAGRTLVPEHPREWKRRLRRRVDHHERGELRFFTVGEYGGKFGRPHYHSIVFGADKSTTIGGRSFASVVREAWGLGDVHVGSDWTDKAAEYVSGYIVKGHNVKGLKVLGGRHPEFSRFPQDPGLGVPGLKYLPLKLEDGDIVPTFLQGNRHLPLGPYLLHKARLAAGLSETDIAALKERAAEAARGEARHSLVGDDPDAIAAAVALFGPLEVRPEPTSVIPAAFSVPHLAKLNRLLF